MKVDMITMGTQQTELLYVYIYIVQVGGIVHDELKNFTIHTFQPEKQTNNMH